MSPQPMMPMTVGSMPGSHSHASEERKAGARRAGRILRLVVLDHHPPGAGVTAGLPEVAPVQHARSDVRPAVLVLVLPGRREVLDVGGGQPTAIAVQPRLRLDPAAH